MRPVDLDELIKTITPAARLKSPLLALAPASVIQCRNVSLATEM
ncbi:hypothetical protein J2Y48_004520 [Mycoplana sp. BE70]|nr:hypothetical protein [Mycoplana sp. BE70]